MHCSDWVNLRKAVCDKYNFQAQIWIWIYSGWFFLANTNTNMLDSICYMNTNTNIFELTKTGGYEYEHEYLDIYLGIQIRIQIFITH